MTDKAVARVAYDSADGVIVSGCDTVIINDAFAAHSGSTTITGSTIVQGSTTVIINDKELARASDETNVGHAIVSGNTNIIVGG